MGCSNNFYQLNSILHRAFAIYSHHPYCKGVWRLLCCACCLQHLSSQVPRVITELIAVAPVLTAFTQALLDALEVPVANIRNLAVTIPQFFRLICVIGSTAVAYHHGISYLGSIGPCCENVMTQMIEAHPFALCILSMSCLHGPAAVAWLSKGRPYKICWPAACQSNCSISSWVIALQA